MSLLFNLADDWRDFAWKYSALDFTRDSSARKPEWALPVGAIPSVKGSFFSAGRKSAPDSIAALPFGVLISGVAEGEIGVMRQSARFFVSGWWEKQRNGDRYTLTTFFTESENILEE